ncbi:MAG: hypothetical protein ACLFTR_00975 [Candidatus Woesearchaeota archaeon]
MTKNIGREARRIDSTLEHCSEGRFSFRFSRLIWIIFVLLVLSYPVYGETIDYDVSEDETIDYCDGYVIEDSTIIDSEVTCTNISNSNVIDSKITNASQDIIESDVEYAVVSKKLLDSGKLYYDVTGYTYYGTRKLSDIYVDEIPPSPEGSAEPSHENIAPESAFHVIYSADSTGYHVTVDASSVGGGSSIELEDDGEDNDEEANDGTYTSRDIVVDSDISTGLKILTVSVDDKMGNQWEVNTSIYVDAEPPDGSIQIKTDDGETDVTESRIVYLHTEADDNVGIDGCRFANENENIEEKEFNTCEDIIPWALTDINGEKTVSYQVRDSTGLESAIYTDSIELNATELNEVPTIEMPSVYWGRPDHVNFTINYNDSVDLSEVTYQYKILADGVNITPWILSAVPKITHDGLNLSEDVNYSIIGRARLGTISPNGSIDFGLNMTPPDITKFTSSVEEDQWTSDPVIYFDLSSEGLDISGFSYRFSSTHATPNDNVDVNGEDAEVYLTGMSPGTYHFTAKVLTKGGLSSDVSNFTVRYDNVIPPAPESDSLAASGGGILTYNWSPVDPVSGVGDYNVQVATDSFFENIVETANASANATSYDYTADVSDTYYFRVRAISNSGLYSPYSTESDAYFDVRPPRFMNLKPSGRIISGEPILNLETNKPCECFYSKNFSQDGEIAEPFDLTGGNVHDARVALEDGEHTLAILCRDEAGIVNSTTTEVEVDKSIEPTEIYTSEEEPIEAYSSFDRDIMLEISDDEGGLGELSLSDFSFRIDGEDYARYTVNDLGGGEYVLSFQAPDSEGEYSAEICYRDELCLDDMTIEVTELRLRIAQVLEGDYVIKEESRLSHVDQDGVTYGMASESPGLFFESSVEENSLVMTSSLKDRNDFLFFVPDDVPKSTLRNKNRQLAREVFSSSMNPMFYSTSGEYQDVAVSLDYGNVLLDGRDEFPDGSHNILFTHGGYTEDGRINISISKDE